jgi:DNA-binding XRE family transcriptional regulator
MELKDRVKQRIKAIRKYKGLTQAKLAELIGRSEDAFVILSEELACPALKQFRLWQTN